MRVLLLLQIVALCMSCGPSAAEIKTAKTAHYRGNASEMFNEVIAVTQETYKIANANGGDEDSYVLATVPQWYTAEGGRESAGDQGYTQIRDHSVRLELIVELVSVAGGFMVTVTPKTFQALSGSPQPRELKPDDPNLPGWVPGRVDSLQLEIHKRLQNYAVQ
ncbi:MAG TPA: hypothetical protein VFV99_24705 [Kofleriaceae bacterium]|nr:hypothetical protein [Kofleriaceae bacterium]